MGSSRGSVTGVDGRKVTMHNNDTKIQINPQIMKDKSLAQFLRNVYDIYLKKMNGKKTQTVRSTY